MIDLRELNGRRCVVLGGRGFIGSHLVAQLTRYGANVLTYGRGKNTEIQVLANVPHISGTLDDAESISSLVKKGDFVFHLIDDSFPAARPSDPINALQSLTIPSARMLHTCVVAEVAKVIFVSSGGAVYGVSTSDLITESEHTHPISAYGVGKLATEKCVQLCGFLEGLDYSILRVSNPYGPGQRPGRGQGLVGTVMQNVVNSKDIEVWGDGEVIRDFVYVGDVAIALAKAAIYRGNKRIVNIGSGEGRTVASVIADIRQLVPWSNSKVIHKSGRPADVPASVLDVSLACAELDWTPTTRWESGLRATLQWVQTRATT